MAKIEKTVIPPNSDKDVEKIDYSYIAGRNIKWYSHSTLKNSLTVFKKKLFNYHKTQHFHSWTFITEKRKRCSHKNVYTGIHSSFVDNSQ